MPRLRIQRKTAGLSIEEHEIIKLRDEVLGLKASLRESLKGEDKLSIANNKYKREQQDVDSLRRRIDELSRISEGKVNTLLAFNGADFSVDGATISANVGGSRQGYHIKLELSYFAANKKDLARIQDDRFRRVRLLPCHEYE